MSQVGQRILNRMLERLFAAIVNGPSLNCRPHHSRQRVDLASLSRLRDIAPAAALRTLLSEKAEVVVAARVPAPPARITAAGATNGGGAEEPPEVAAARRAWQEQQGLLTKLRTVVEEARTYEDDTGVWVLNIGFPLLSLPPGTAPGRQTTGRRVLAPIALIPVSMTVRTGTGAGVEIACRGDEADRVTPNEALLSWLEQQTGKPRPELFSDEEGEDPWREIAELVRHVAGVVGVEPPALFTDNQMPEEIPLVPAPTAEEAGESPSIVAAAVVGLFPLSNQGLIRDTREMIQSGPGAGPIESFLRAEVTLADVAAEPDSQEAAWPKEERRIAAERLVAPADPCQARAVAMARTSSGLVIHGPPGTGKSQTITNIIGDHLARGERVLFVCDKRTALDVVASRLEHLGLGDLCAVVHDPQRDQRDLYRSIREQLERLTETRTDAKAAADVEKLDQELDRVLGELREVHDGLMGDRGSGSLHDLVGRWLELVEEGNGADGITSLLGSATLDELLSNETDLREVLSRAADAGYADNPWTAAAGITVENLVSRPMDQFRAAMERAERAAAAADQTAHESIPPFLPDLPLEDQAAARSRLAGLIDKALSARESVRTHWASRDADAVRRGRTIIAGAAQPLEAVRKGGDAELWAVVRAAPPEVAEITQRLGVLESYLRSARAWWGFLAFPQRSAAGKVLTPLGLPLSPESAERARSFYSWLRALRVLAGIVDQLEGRSPGMLPEAEALEEAIKSHAAVLDAVGLVVETPALAPLAEPLAAALRAGPSSPEAAAVAEGLDRSGPRAKALAELESSVNATALFAAAWLKETFTAWRSGRPAADQVRALRERLPTLEDVLRAREGLAALPASLAPAAKALVEASAQPDSGLRMIRRGVLEAEITRRLESEPRLRALDARRMTTLFSRYAELEARKRERVRDAILHHWVSRQRERLLASTGSRLNSQGAEVKRRLAIRGRHAMRLRQVLALGRGAEGGDPLLDLRPVWMASPETVAQIFPRERIFDVVVFDEASQCRLEEALPVLTRAGRVVVAGDPKQLPPTRFFESAIATSDPDEIESDQDLFEAQQSEVEDLLAAALGLDVQQSYLDVHYRSRNSDLIAFSNDNFYGRRLQPIPGHPRHAAKFAPITLYQVNGVYEKRENEIEAEQVCRIIRDLLKRANPPSIGVGCFNIAQRDLINEKLEQMAAADASFAKALAAARERRGSGAAEHLFVKNLENVQGDERDHIIISTTYGPDPRGRFYRRFGPLAMPGGGRRLNVLVTRARQEVHIVTSIPPEVYRALPPVPPGQTPGGGWLLFAYLKFAEEVGALYRAQRELEADGRDEPPEERAAPIIRESAAPSALAAALAYHLAETRGVGSTVHWGNDGFCVDLALAHPERADAVTAGVLCDFSRFHLAPDAVEWDLFRTSVLESQGWELVRLWAPVVFRDRQGVVDQVLRKAAAAARAGDAPD